MRRGRSGNAVAQGCAFCPRLRKKCTFSICVDCRRKGSVMSTAQRVRWILLAGVAAAGIASAAGYEVNGVRLGMTQAEVQGLFGDKIDCKARTPTDGDPSQVSCVAAAFSRDKVLTDTFAGQKTVIWYNLLDGHVARITFLGFPSLAFDD